MNQSIQISSNHHLLSIENNPSVNLQVPMDVKRPYTRASTAIQYEDFDPDSEVQEVPNAHILLVYLPDFKKDQMKITYVDKTRIVRVNGERTSTGNKRLRFNQAYSVPPNCEDRKIHAKFQNGVLTVTMPKKIDSQPSNTSAQKPTTDPKAFEPEPKTPALSEKPKTTTPLQPAKEATTTVPPPSNEPITAPLAPPKEPKATPPPPVKEPKMAPQPPAKEPKAAPTPPPAKEPKAAPTPPPSKEAKATLPALPKEPKTSPPLPQRPQDSAINNNAIEKKEVEKVKLQEELSGRKRESLTQHETEETKKRKGSEVPHQQETAETSSKTSGKKKKKKKTAAESLNMTSKGDLVSEKFQGVKNFAAAAKESVKGFRYDFNEDRQSIVNIGAAVLVIAAFGAYLSYKCGLFASSKSNN